jgi:serine phosphatase RsbU (regulator of sigma subunit)
MYTDGVTDAMAPNGDLFGPDGLNRFLVPDEALPDACRPKRIGERLVGALRRHASGRAQNDDIAVVCFGRLEPAAGPGTGVARAVAP